MTFPFLHRDQDHLVFARDCVDRMEGIGHSFPVEISSTLLAATNVRELGQRRRDYIAQVTESPAAPAVSLRSPAEAF